MSQIVRYTTALRPLRNLAAVALAAFALAIPAVSSASELRPDARPDGGIQLTTPSDPYSAASRPDGGIPLTTPSASYSAASRADGGIPLTSSQSIPVAESSSSDGTDWGYFAAGGFVLLMLGGTAVLMRRRHVGHVKATPAH